MLLRAPSEAGKRFLRMVGVDGRFGRGQERSPRTAPPILLEDAQAAWHFERVGSPASFPCPLSRCVNSNGFSYSLGGWDPFVACAREYIAGGAQTYETSVLARYYRAWQPRDAAEATLCFELGEPPLGGRPSHLFALYPWLPDSFEEFDARVRHWVRQDNEEHGHASSTIEHEGYKVHGPVSPAIGQLEHRRLTEVTTSIRTDDFDRSLGDVYVVQITDGGRSRFIEQGGMHRMAAMAALGHEVVPARLLGVFDVRDAALWPGVRLGRWSEEAARRYVHHLFTFDSRAWAEKASLV